MSDSIPDLQLVLCEQPAGWPEMNLGIKYHFWTEDAKGGVRGGGAKPGFLCSRRKELGSRRSWRHQFPSQIFPVDNWIFSIITSPMSHQYRTFERFGLEDFTRRGTPWPKSKSGLVSSLWLAPM